MNTIDKLKFQMENAAFVGIMDESITIAGELEAVLRGRTQDVRVAIVSLAVALVTVCALHGARVDGSDKTVADSAKTIIDGLYEMFGEALTEYVNKIQQKG